ncbi:SH3 domain-containing protein [Methyloligella sp. 2.7D]|uniref:SH3 domain-containing protein n=1 Tax=unclassified Methyloligella TaxID=2625955 RepID=UPI00157CC0A8|nr:SH3 domain-containing protein [Methyloligella sp. GL2]QKP76418.1 SH3 domain-containing protein [Methyloligella sp. GL2]
MTNLRGETLPDALKGTAFAALLALGLGASASLVPAETHAEPRTIPVIAGQNAGYDACGTVGQVAGLDPNGDGFLAVRAGPQSDYDLLDKLQNGEYVYVCDQSGKWYGVVYGPPGRDCGVTHPWPQAAAYKGPCFSGWVFGKYIREAAG